MSTCGKCDVFRYIHDFYTQQIINNIRSNENIRKYSQDLRTYKCDKVDLNLFITCELKLTEGKLLRMIFLDKVIISHKFIIIIEPFTICSSKIKCSIFFVDIEKHNIICNDVTTFNLYDLKNVIDIMFSKYYVSV